MKNAPRKMPTDLRSQHNKDILRRMRGGEPLMSFDSRDSWYPPRPTIKKDAREVQRVYRQGDEAVIHSQKSNDNSCGSSGLDEVS